MLLAIKGMDEGAKWATNDEGILAYTPGSNKIRIAIVAGTAETGPQVIQDAIKSFKAPGSYRYECEGDRIVLKAVTPKGPDFQFTINRL